MKLTRHFNLGEFTQSQTATRMGMDIEPPPEVVQSLKALCVNILEPLRLDLRRSMFITSGYRPAWLNEKIGGAPNSQHIKGEAADFVAAWHTPRQICKRILLLELPFDQLILEFDRWVHVSYRDAPRRQAMTATKVGGTTRYQEGIDTHETP